jgi:hypothetical protein
MSSALATLTTEGLRKSGLLAVKTDMFGLPTAFDQSYWKEALALSHIALHFRGSKYFNA